MPTDQFAGQFIAEYVQAALGAQVGVPVGPVQTQFGYHVILVRPYDELTPDDLAPISVDNEAAQAAFDDAIERADIYINPRYGAFDPVSGVVPLG
jgi:parvulin-like peptidyl-prolyl isomerase